MSQQAREQLHVVIRTPRETVIEQDVVAIRVPTQTGQVGLRPRGEPNVLAVEVGFDRTQARSRCAILRHGRWFAACSWCSWPAC